MPIRPLTAKELKEMGIGQAAMIHKGQYYTVEQYRSIKRMSSQDNTGLLRAGA